MKKILVLQIVGSFVYGGYFWMCLLTSKDFHFIDTVNLIFHEAGHAIFFFLPPILVALAGSVFQILGPLSFVIYFYKRKEYLSACLLVFWLAQNINSVSLYVRDAIPMQLPLLGGEGSVHDWNYIFLILNMLELSTFCANILLFIAYFSATGVTLLILEHFMVSIKAKRKEVDEVHEETKID